MLENEIKKRNLAEFIESQKRDWPLAFTNYKGLEKVKEKRFDFEGFEILVQFNPERIRSSAANVDKTAIAARKCFLCAENRPAEQDSIALGSDFLVLVNPFPIFKRHFTIPSVTHTDQRFLPNVLSFLNIAENMEGYTLFYNGPECGASAPDHFHFQAGEFGFMPVDYEFNRLKPYGKIILNLAKSRVWIFENYLRRMVSIESESKDEALKIINSFYETFQTIQPEKSEPLINAICSFSDEKWTIHLFPRKLHRPSQYFAQGENQILISPASVDFGGVFITPRYEDYEKITKDDIADIFEQVCLDDLLFQELIKGINNFKKSGKFNQPS